MGKKSTMEGRSGPDNESPATQSQVSSSLASTELDWSFLKVGRLFERKTEKTIIVNAFHRRLRPDSLPELLLVSGSSGTGKTVLALQLRKYVHERGGYFVMGKFDQMKRIEPYAPLISAITEFINYILDSKDDQFINSARNSILKEVKDDIGILTGMIPALEELVGKHKANPLKGADVEDRFKAIFSRFVRAACTPLRPLVLIMDDLQWADTGSLELLAGIVSDPYNHALVTVGICRSNEVSLNHGFAKILRQLEDENDTVITNVELERFSLQGTNQLISSVLRQPEKECVSIALTLYKKTDGNPFFLVELVKALCEHQVLIPDTESGQWLWDDERWYSDFIDVENITDLILQRIQRLSTECRLFLSTCACLGAEIDELLISKLTGKSLNVQEALSVCVGQGIILLDEETRKYRFSHDRCQQASYQLINRDETTLFHLSIGRLLLKDLSKGQLDEYLFVVVDQLSRGIDASTMNRDEKLQIAGLCLRAGERSMISNDLQTALKYLKLGKSLLDIRREWRDNYELVLGFENSIAQASCLTADYAVVDEAVNSISLHARSFRDKIPGLTLQIYAMGITLRLQEALTLGLEVLKYLGEKIPEKPSKFRLVASLLNVKRMLRGKSDRDIMHLPDMKDSNKLCAMNVLNLLVAVTYLGKRNLFPFVALGMVR